MAGRWRWSVFLAERWARVSTWGYCSPVPRLHPVVLEGVLRTGWRRDTSARGDDMADEKSARSDDGKGAPGGSVYTTITGRPRDGRQLPGGSIEAANTPIGINAVDPGDLPSGGNSTGQE